MRKFLLAFVFLLFVSAAAIAQQKSGDTMVHKIFTALKNKNENDFVALFPNYAQMNRFLRSSLEAELKSAPDSAMARTINVDSMVHAMMGEMTEDAFKEQMQKEFSHSFRSILEEGETKGLNWGNAMLTKYTLDSTLEESFPSLHGVMDLKEGE